MPEIDNPGVDADKRLQTASCSKYPNVHDGLRPVEDMPLLIVVWGVRFLSFDEKRLRVTKSHL